MKRTLRMVVGALAVALALVFAPGVGVLGGASDASAQASVTKLTHAQATTMFRNAGITWSSSGGCSDRNNPTCTSFEGLNLPTAQGADDHTEGSLHLGGSSLL